MGNQCDDLRAKLDLFSREELVELLIAVYVQIERMRELMNDNDAL